jgi:hypothetical protein
LRLQLMRFASRVQGRATLWPVGRFVRGGAAVLILLGLAAGISARAHAENHFSVRGTYFREPSTRVVQPMMEAEVDLPKGYVIGAHAAVDAISSASIGQGVGTDKVFRENRYEAGLRVGKDIDGNKVVGFFRYSNEPDYKAYSGGLTYTREVWGRTGILGLSVARSHDDIRPVFQAEKALDVWSFGVAYNQILTPTTVVQVGYEMNYLDGFYGNPYIATPDLGREDLPEVRIRHAFAIKAAQYIPDLSLGVQLLYRFYLDQGAFGALDPWGMTAHTIEGRIYKNLGTDFEVRLSYRYHWQGNAGFWCNANPANGGMLGCYGMTPEFHSWDPKFGHLTTHLPELRVTWDLRALALTPVLRHLAGGAIDVSYGFLFETTPYGAGFSDKNAPPVIGHLIPHKYGGAHIIQTGYSLPF